MKKDNEHHTTRNSIILFSVIFLLLYFYINKKENNNYSTPLTATTADKSDLQLTAFSVSKEFIKEKLKHPNMAEFSHIPIITQKLDDNTFKIKGSVLAYNSFGVKDNKTYEITMLFLGGDEYDTKNWKAGGIKIY